MLLSIVIPSYNHGQFVLSTIEAAARIGIADKEIIVIDDGSSDNSVRIIREYIAARESSGNIRMIARDNRGLVKTLNEGLRLAQGKYFYVVASDDIPIPEGVTELVRLLEGNAERQFAMGNALVMYSEQHQEFRQAYAGTQARFFALPPSIRKKEMFMNYPHPLLLQASVFRASALQAIGGWREDILLDDYSLFVRMLSRFSKAESDFIYRPEIAACFYRQHPKNCYNNTARQFMMVEQALTVLCPQEWLPPAISRKAAYYIQVSLRKRMFAEAAQLLRSTVARVGIICFLQGSAQELKRIMEGRLPTIRKVLPPPIMQTLPVSNPGTFHE